MIGYKKEIIQTVHAILVEQIQLDYRGIEE